MLPLNHRDLQRQIGVNELPKLPRFHVSLHGSAEGGGSQESPACMHCCLHLVTDQRGTRMVIDYVRTAGGALPTLYRYIDEYRHER